MSQYQTFPEAPGASMTVEKLKALCLPELAGKRFLDVGCNEGFFCGYAIREGATRVVGIDNSAHFIARARERFAAGDFRLQGWDNLPEGPFDVILLASALHYADDQPALVRRLMELLSKDGVLVLEMGVISSPTAEWRRIKRDIDERMFPTMGAVRELLAGYAWKWMGQSSAQAGDPVGRHVFHVSGMRPMAYLLMQPPAYGKTTIADGLFRPAGIPVVSGDNLLLRISRGERSAPESLASLLAESFSPFEVDKSIHQMFERGAAEAFMAVVIEEAGGSTFALDAYLPAERHAWVQAWLSQHGFLPVVLSWDRVGGGLLSAEDAESRAEDYFMSLVGGCGEVRASTIEIPKEGLGFVDDVDVVDGLLRIRGWYVDAGGSVAGSVMVRLGGHLLEGAPLERQTRPDVQQHLALAHSLVGFVVRVPIPSSDSGSHALSSVAVYAGAGSSVQEQPLPLAGLLAEKLASVRT